MKDIAPSIWPPGKRIGWYLIIDEFFFFLTFIANREEYIFTGF